MQLQDVSSTRKCCFSYRPAIALGFVVFTSGCNGRLRLMDRETFPQRLHQPSIAAHDLAREFFFMETLPDKMLFRSRLNQSYDGNPLHADELLYPDDGILNLTEKLARCAEEEAVNLLWREGRAPEWVDLFVVAKRGSATIMRLVCCGRFTNQPFFVSSASPQWSCGEVLILILTLHFVFTSLSVSPCLRGDILVFGCGSAALHLRSTSLKFLRFFRKFSSPSPHIPKFAFIRADSWLKVLLIRAHQRKSAANFGVVARLRCASVV